MNIKMCIKHGAINLLELKPAVAGAVAPLRVGGDFKRVASPVNQI